jgi:hypothetical protein
MTANQLEYNYNAKRCKLLGLEIEQLTTELYYHRNASYLHLIDDVEQRLRDKRITLETLWSVQIDLFFEIRKENELITNNA